MLEYRKGLDARILLAAFLKHGIPPVTAIKKGFPIVANHKETLSQIYGAEGESRTRTPERALDPKSYPSEKEGERKG